MNKRTMKEDNIRPWGEYHVLYSGDTFKVKRIIVKPKKRLSLQSHNHRKENWIITEGRARYQKGEHTYYANSGESIVIGRGEKHRIENINDDEDLVFVEVQTGDYFGEDDIIRYEDDFGRVEGETK